MGALAAMIQANIGLPTLSGCARAIVTLVAQRLPDELRPHVKKLMQVLLNGLRDR